MTDTTSTQPRTVPGINPDLAKPATEFVCLDTKQIAEVRDLLVRYSERLAGTSRRSLVVVYLVALMNITSIALFQWYFVVIKGHSWLWTPLPLIILAVPIGVLWVYYRILSAVGEIPSVILNTADDAIQSVSGYKQELSQLNEGRLTLFKRWKSYIFFGKVLWKIYQLSSSTSDAIGSFALLSLMINPIFWVVLLISLIISFIFSGLLVLICVLHYMVF